MITAPPVRVLTPTGPPPGRVETAVGLFLGHAFPAHPGHLRAARAALLGVDGGPPLSWSKAARSTGTPLDALLDRRQAARRLARTLGTPRSLACAVAALQDGPRRSAAHSARDLQAAGYTHGLVHPGAILTAAAFFGAPVTTTLHRPDRCGDATSDGPGNVVVVPAWWAQAAGRVEQAAEAATAVHTAVPVAGVAAEAGTDEGVALQALATPSWVLHHEPAGTDDLDGAGGAVIGQWWVWRTATGHRRGVPGALALRAVAVRPYTPAELHQATVQAVARMPPRARRDATTPPAGVLAAWLTRQDLLDPDTTEATTGATSRGAAGPVLRGRPEHAARVDVVLLEAVAAHGGTASTAQLAHALTAAGYAPSSSQGLHRQSPVLVRTGPDTHQAR